MKPAQLLGDMSQSIRPGIAVVCCIRQCADTQTVNDNRKNSLIILLSESLLRSDEYHLKE